MNVEAERPLRRDAAENRQRLLSAAARVFAERGPEAGVEEIARVAGVGMGTLYRRFPTKHALVDELVSGLRARLAHVGQQALAQTPDKSLEQMLYGTGEVLFTHRGCLHRLWMESSAGRDHLEDYRLSNRLVLERAQQAGVARPELTPTDITVAIWAVRGIIDTTHAFAPHAWRRHVEIVLDGFHPAGRSLAHSPVTGAQLEGLNAQTSTTIGNNIGRRR